MSEALRDRNDQTGAERLEQTEAEDRAAPKLHPREPAPARPTTGVGMPVAEAELLGEYNLYNG